MFTILEVLEVLSSRAKGFTYEQLVNDANETNVGGVVDDCYDAQEL